MIYHAIEPGTKWRGLNEHTSNYAIQVGNNNTSLAYQCHFLQLCRLGKM